MASAQTKSGTAALFQLLALPASVAFLLRMSLLWWIHRDRDAHQFLFFPTSHETWNVAWSMALGKGFSGPLAGMHGPTAWVAPVYPWLIAAFLKITHLDSYSATVLALSANSVAAALTCWPIYGIGKRIASHEVGLASCWLWVFLPTAIIFPLEWLWDPSFSAFFLALLVYWTLHLTDASSVRPWVGYGAVWGISMLVNPATGILFPFFVLWLAQRRRQSQRVRALPGARRNLSWISRPAMAVAFCFICLAPWTVRNYAAFGRLIPVKDNFGLELWLGNNAGVKRNWSPDHHPVGDPNEMQQLLRLGEADYMQAKQRQAIEFIAAHPRTFLRSVFDRFVDTWTGLADVPSDRWVAALRAGTAYLWFVSAFSLLAFAGLGFAWRSSGWEGMPAWIAPIIFPATYYITHSILRYRHPIDPLLTVFAVYALARARSLVSRRAIARDALKVTEA